MRAFKLREEKSFIKVLKEPPRKEKKVNWNRRIYLSLLILGSGWLIRRIFLAYFLINANGQLELPKQTISFPDDIELLQFYVQEGHRVQKGDTLFTYKISSDLHSINSLTKSAEKEWILKDILTTKNHLRLKKIELSALLKEIDILSNTKVQKEKLLMLGLNQELDAYQSISLKIDQNLLNVEILEKEISLLHSQLASLDQASKDYRKEQNERLAALTETKAFISSRTGTISDIFYEPHEICYKKEELMTIHKNDGASITTYFNPEEASHVQEGDIVEIEFPDGTSSKGVIEKLLVSTYALPSEFQKKYEPTERNIVAEVTPLLKSDEETWNNFYKLDVTIKKWRYGLF